jgi:hypothetical protein
MPLNAARQTSVVRIDSRLWVPLLAAQWDG